METLGVIVALIVCGECGQQVSESANRCPHCGYSSGTYKGKSKGVAIILALFLGGLGIHKFYLGRTTAGFVYLIFCWTFIPAVLGLIDAIVLATKSERQFSGSVGKSYKDSSGLEIDDFGQTKPFYKQPAFWLILVAVIILIAAANYGMNQ